ncbi:MAG: MBOAT family protein [Elusimicrobiota bacterium]|jgi:D-alanyl-lipoteichoic acid acyltransferase DltB (MBOAT superfamily)|nr:MBOAT family protein [Elusimicrobiota bacterium]
MILTSFYFFLFLIATVLLYYALPKKFQWILLLGASVFFYLFSGLKMLGLWVFITSVVIWGGAYCIDKFNQKQNDASDIDTIKICERHKKMIILVALFISLGILGFFKYYNFFAENVNVLMKLFHINNSTSPIIKLLLPLGISYWTFQSVGYLIDIYRGMYPAQKNPLKFLLFSMFFPSVSMGPIHRYNDLAPQLFAQHSFDYKQATFGAQRILWGLFKKLVIADRLAMFVNPVFDGYAQYSGFYLLIAIIFFAFQLYADFSGCMDIVIGAGQLFGIKMTENFNKPFFSKSISEFWRRWHMTLGLWMKDYVFYPLLKSDLLQAFQQKLKIIVSKKTAKAIPLYSGMFVLWFVMGLWHGAAWHFIIGAGLMFWLYIVSGELFKPLLNKIISFLEINKTSAYWKAFQIIRTFTLLSFDWIFFRAASVKDALQIISKLFAYFEIYIYLILFVFLIIIIFRIISVKKTINIFMLPLIAALSSGIGIMIWRILSQKTTAFVLIKGIDYRDFILSVILIMFLMSYEFIQNRIGSGRQWLAKQRIAIRWLFYWALLFVVIMFGKYGGLTAASFIYQGF